MNEIKRLADKDIEALVRPFGIDMQLGMSHRVQSQYMHSAHNAICTSPGFEGTVNPLLLGLRDPVLSEGQRERLVARIHDVVNIATQLAAHPASQARAVVLLVCCRHLTLAYCVLMASLLLQDRLRAKADQAWLLHHGLNSKTSIFPYVSLASLKLALVVG